MKSLALNLAVAKMEQIERKGGYIENIEFKEKKVKFLIFILENKIPQLFESNIQVIKKEINHNSYNKYLIIYDIKNILKGVQNEK